MRKAKSMGRCSYLFILSPVSYPTCSFLSGKGDCLSWGRSHLSLPFFSPLGAKTSEEQITPTKSQSRKEKAVGSREAVRERQGSSRGRKGVQGLGTAAPPHPRKVRRSVVDTVPPPATCVRR